MVEFAKFGSLVDFVSSPTPAGKASLETYISTDNMLPDFNGVTAAIQLPKSGNIRQFQVGDTLFSNIRTYFRKVWGASFNGTCSPDVLLFRSKDSQVLNAKFLEYICKWDVFTEHTVKTSRGAKMPRGDKAAIADFEFPLPDLQYQENVADFLASLDDKIELNRRMNEVLEGMARAVFADWFVDFGPTRRKMAGEVDPVKILGGAIRPPAQAQKTAALFPDRLGENGLPEGWEEVVLYDLADWINGAAYKNMHFSEDKNALPVIKIVELKNGVTGNTKFTSTELGEKYRIKSGEILFSWSGNPETSIDTFIWNGGEAWLNQHIFAVRGNGMLDTPLTYFLLRNMKPIFTSIARDKQTTGLGHVTKKDLRWLKVCLGSAEMRVAANEFFTPIFEKISNNTQENQTLAEMRDLLLPKLMSGEIRLREGG